jgi:hypothetical protein
MAYPLSALQTDRLWAIATALFPKQTAKAQAWVTAEAKRLGMDYAQQYAQEKVAEATTNPLVWAALGLGAFGLVFGLMRRR